MFADALAQSGIAPKMDQFLVPTGR
jgi:hypothetical protein